MYWLYVLADMQAPLFEALSRASLLVSLMAGLAGLGVLIYRLGMWRQEMVDTKHNVGAEVSRCRADMTRGFEALERRFGAFDAFVAAATEQRVGVERWQARVETMLAAHEREIGRTAAIAQSAAGVGRKGVA